MRKIHFFSNLYQAQKSLLFNKLQKIIINLSFCNYQIDISTAPNPVLNGGVKAPLSIPSILLRMLRRMLSMSKHNPEQALGFGSTVLTIPSNHPERSRGIGPGCVEWVDILGKISDTTLSNLLLLTI